MKGEEAEGRDAWLSLFSVAYFGSPGILHLCEGVAQFYMSTLATLPRAPNINQKTVYPIANLTVGYQTPEFKYE